MKIDNFDTEQCDELFERRAIGRTTIFKGAKLFFNAQQGPVDCGVRDITNTGAGVRADGLSILPVNFELSFDNFHTIRECRLIWRDGDFLGVAFQN
jgi:hypothetical protein